MRKITALSFEGQTIFCGLDVHKNSWHVNIRSEDFELEDYSQNPDEELLLNHLRKNYPGATFKVAYEAGFSGFWLQRALSRQGVDCMVVNPADVPCSDKEKSRKNDRMDARKLCRQLSNKALEGIYVPPLPIEQARTLVRYRTRLVRDQTRCKNRISHLLLFSGLNRQAASQKQNWGQPFIDYLKKLPCETLQLRQSLDIAIEEFLLIKKLLLATCRQIQALSQEAVFAPMHRLLRTIPGIGISTAMILQTEIYDMRRFKTLDQLCSYAGIVPDTASSGDHEKIRGITHRHNAYLRPTLVECSWMVIRKDPAMLLLYKKYVSMMHANKAIVKIARHLLSRIRYVWMNQVEYVTGIVG